MSMLNVAVDPSLTSAAQLVQTTSPSAAWLQFGAGTAFLILSALFWMLLGHIFGQLKVSLKVPWSSSASSASGSRRPGST